MFPETHYLAVASPQKDSMSHNVGSALTRDTWRVTDLLKMFSRCTCTADADMWSNIVLSMYVYHRSRHVWYHHDGGPSTFKSSSFGVCSVSIPAAPRFFQDINRASNINLQHCPFVNKRKQTVASLYLWQDCYPVALHCVPRKTWLRKSLQTFVQS